MAKGLYEKSFPRNNPSEGELGSGKATFSISFAGNNLVVKLGWKREMSEFGNSVESRAKNADQLAARKVSDEEAKPGQQEKPMPAKTQSKPPAIEKPKASDRKRSNVVSESAAKPTVPLKRGKNVTIKPKSDGVSYKGMFVSANPDGTATVRVTGEKKGGKSKVYLGMGKDGKPLARIDKKSLFRRHGHSPAGTGMKERFRGREGSKPSRRSQLLAKTGCERNRAVDETSS